LAVRHARRDPGGAVPVRAVHRRLATARPVAGARGAPDVPAQPQLAVGHGRGPAAAGALRRAGAGAGRDRRGVCGVRRRRPPAALAVARRPNVVVTRSFSKSHALAGVRFGFAVADPALVREFNKVKDSYNCDVLSLAAATAALEDAEYYRGTRERILRTRARL